MKIPKPKHTPKTKTKTHHQIQDHNKKDIVLLDQGSNGCIFHPEIKCSNSIIKRQRKDGPKYISKIQLQINAAIEQEIGKKIATIPKFRYYFAPILESCPVSLSTIDERQIEKCDIVAKTPAASFVSSTIQYLGKTTLGEYLLKSAYQPREYIVKILDTHLYLLDALIKLQQVDIVHFDLKGNNIMQDETNDVPIIIDFGMSILNIDSLDIEDYYRVFPTIAEEYFPWCIDVILLCYIATTLQKREKDLSRTYDRMINEKDIAQMKRHASVYVFKNPIMQISRISQEERVNTETQLHTWIESQKSKTWKQFAKELISYHKSWDTYSLSAIYLLELDDLNTVEDDNTNDPSQQSAVIHTYLNMLKTNILQTSQTRSTPNTIASNIRSSFKTIKKASLAQFIKNQLTKIKTPGYLTSVIEKRQQRSFKEKESREKIQRQIARRLR